MTTHPVKIQAHLPTAASPIPIYPPQIRQAEEICRKAGVESELMDGCISCVANTGDASFAQSAANALLDTAKDRLLQQLRNQVPVPPLAKRYNGSLKVKNPTEFTANFFNSLDEEEEDESEYKINCS